MLSEETKAYMKDICLGDERATDRDLSVFLEENRGEVCRTVNPEDGAVLSLIKLRGLLTRDEIREAFPSFRRRREDNLIARGLLEEDQGTLSVPDSGCLSLYPLLGEKTDEETLPRPDDLVKGMMAMAAHQGIRERDWRLGKAFQSDEFISAFPAYSPDEIKAASLLIASRLTALGLVRQEGKKVIVNSSNALSFLSLSPESAWSYLLFPDIDERMREKSFTFMSLLFRLGKVRTEDFDRMLTILETASGFKGAVKEDLFTMGLLEERDGYVLTRSEEKPLENAVVSSDWTVNFSGSTPPLIALMAHLRTSDRMKIWLISKSSVKSAFALGYGTEEITRYLESLSDLPVNPMLERRIESWESEWKSLRFERALVLRTDETRDRIIRNIPQLSPYIIEHPKEGIFLMDYETEDEWRDLLYTFGFDMLAPTVGPEFKERMESREFLESECTVSLPELRSIPYDRERVKELMKMTQDPDRSERKMKILMIERGILFTEDAVKRHTPFRKADCWNYIEKVKLLDKAEKDRQWCVLGEDYKGSSTIGTVEMVSPFEEGDRVVLGRSLLRISRLYRVFLIPASFV